MHLYIRAGFGLSIAEAAQISRHSISKMVARYIKNACASSPLTLINYTSRANFKLLNIDEKKALIKEMSLQRLDLNVAWLGKFSEPESQLRERLTLFWHGHFACRDNNPYLMQELNNIQRQYALENFRDLLIGVSKSAAMLNFLNNQQNLKGHPNENFAREVMELFTIGHGNYTELDIREAARSFTGWQHDKNFEFCFNDKIHDTGEKTFMGKTGNFSGEDIIDIILARPETSHFLAAKLYAFFVSDTPDNERIAEMAAIYYKSNYNTIELLSYVFNADWFYDTAIIGSKIKSPVEFIAILNKTFQIKYANPHVLYYLQQLLGQTLFNPPNVSGWAGGRAWIDTSSLLFRMKIPSVILNSGLIEFEGKHDPEEEAQIALYRKKATEIQKRVNASVDWDQFLNNLPDPISQHELITYFLPSGLNENERTKVLSINRSDLKGVIIQLISTPEYQLC